MEATMFNRQAALFVILIFGLVLTSGSLAVLEDTKGHSYPPLPPPQIDSFDMMSNVWDSPGQKNN
jgi:hypothetical protein